MGIPFPPTSRDVAPTSVPHCGSSSLRRVTSRHVAPRETEEAMALLMLLEIFSLSLLDPELQGASGGLGEAPTAEAGEHDPKSFPQKIDT